MHAKSKGQRGLLQVPVVSDVTSAFLPSTTPLPQLPVAGSSAFVHAAQTAILEDPVDSQIDSALAPALDPLMDGIARTPVFADVLAALVGDGTPAVSLHRGVCLPASRTCASSIACKGLRVLVIYSWS